MTNATPEYAALLPGYNSGLLHQTLLNFLKLANCVVGRNKRSALRRMNRYNSHPSGAMPVGYCAPPLPRQTLLNLLKRANRMAANGSSNPITMLAINNTPSSP